MHMGLTNRQLFREKQTLCVIITASIMSIIRTKAFITKSPWRTSAMLFKHRLALGNAVLQLANSFEWSGHGSEHALAAPCLSHFGRQSGNSPQCSRGSRIIIIIILVSNDHNANYDVYIQTHANGPKSVPSPLSRHEQACGGNHV